MTNTPVSNDPLILDDRENRPLEVEVHPEAVVITGPQGVSLALTPEAALASAEVLAEAAAEAIDLGAAEDPKLKG